MSLQNPYPVTSSHGHNLCSTSKYRECKNAEGDWNKDFIEELRNFPNGAHDDQVDAGSDAFNELHEGFETFFTDIGFAR